MYFCVVLCIVCFVLFSVLFGCIGVLYYCHRAATQLQLNISYHMPEENRDSCKPFIYLSPKILQSVRTHSAIVMTVTINPLKPELNPICYLLALLGHHYFLHVSRIRVKLLTLR